MFSHSELVNFTMDSLSDVASDGLPYSYLQDCTVPSQESGPMTDQSSSLGSGQSTDESNSTSTMPVPSVLRSISLDITSSSYGPVITWSTIKMEKPATRLFSKLQTSELEQRFEHSSFIEREEIKALAGRLGLAPHQVKTWFTNRRNRLKSKSNLKNTKKFLSKARKTSKPPRQMVSSPEASDSLPIVVRLKKPKKDTKKASNETKFSPKLRALLSLPASVSCSEQNMLQYRRAAYGWSALSWQTPSCEVPTSDPSPFVQQYTYEVTPVVEDLLPTSRFFSDQQQYYPVVTGFMDVDMSGGLCQPPMSLEYPELETKSEFSAPSEQAFGGVENYFDPNMYFMV